jgi:polyribonucleotide nucleotidyltransferase
MSYTLKTPTIITTEHDFYGQKLTISTGLMAPNADAAVRVKLGETEVLVTTVMNRNPNPNKDFLPLSIDFRDYYAAVGKIGGGAYRTREGRPTEMMTLYGRIVDRTLRPMFPKGMINDVVVTITPLSCDRETDLAILGILGGSLTTLMASIPFDGPVSGVRVGFNQKIQDNQKISEDLLKINPTNPEFDTNGFNLLVSGKSGSLNMIEMDGMEISEDMMQSAFDLAQKAMDELCVIQQKFLTKAKETTKG